MSRVRFPLMLAALAALVLGVWAGLLRIGWRLEPDSTRLLAAHGPLMVTGFLETVISVERAVALGARAGYAGPVLVVLGVVALLMGAADT